MAFLDGQRVEEAALSFQDRALQYGEGVFETIGIWDRTVIDFDGHWERLESSAALFGIQPLTGRRRVQGEVEALAHECGDGVAKVLVCGGRAQDLRGEHPREPHVWVGHRPPPIKSSPSLEVSDVVAHYPLGPAKSLSMIAVHLAAARRSTFDDVLLLTPEGTVAEASTANVFFLLDGTWWTPQDGMLRGRTRSAFIAFLGEKGESCTEANIEVNRLLDASSIVLTNSGSGAFGARSLEGRSLVEHPELYAEFREWVVTRWRGSKPRHT